MARKLDRKGDFGIHRGKRLFELLGLLEITVGLALGDGPVAGQVLGGVGQDRMLAE